MKRIFNKARGFKEAADWDIKQQIEMSPEERLEAATILRKRVYGSNVPDVRSAEIEK